MSDQRKDWWAELHRIADGMCTCKPNPETFADWEPCRTCEAAKVINRAVEDAREEFPELF